MAEYIEREAVLKHKRKMSGADFGGEFWDEAVLCEDIRKIPTADVVPVVRCEKCSFYEEVEYYHPIDPNPTKKVCRLLKMQMQPDDYCSYGERRCSDESRIN